MALFDFLSLTPKSSIGGITIAASIHEVHTDTLAVTEHPVELGAPITDHAYNRPAEVSIEAGWSNSTWESIKNEISALISGGRMEQKDYISSVYSQLVALQQSRQPFSVTTARRGYDNMLITSLTATTDVKTSNVLVVRAICRQVILVSTKSTSLPSRDNQANPANTAEVENSGTKQVKPNATPAPGGAVAPGSI